jgi:YjbE family integral membrane protein
MFDAYFWAALFGIIWVDLLLSGDNAVVIAMVSRRLPSDEQRKVIVFGTVAAVLARIGMAFIADLLSLLYGLSIIAGLYLMKVAYDLLTHGEDEAAEKEPVTKFLGITLTAFASAVLTITVADVMMSLDNVLAIAALAHGHWILMALGVALSIPMVILFAVAISALIERFPFIKWIGAAVLAWAAGGIVANDPLLKMVPHYDAHLSHLAAGVTAVLIVLGTAWVELKRRDEPTYADRYL